MKCGEDAKNSTGNTRIINYSIAIGVSRMHDNLSLVNLPVRFANQITSHLVTLALKNYTSATGRGFSRERLKTMQS